MLKHVSEPLDNVLKGMLRTICKCEKEDIELIEYCLDHKLVQCKICGRKFVEEID